MGGAVAGATDDAPSTSTPSASILNKGVKRKHVLTEKRTRMPIPVSHTLADSRAIPLATEEVMAPRTKRLRGHSDLAAGTREVPLPLPEGSSSSIDTAGADSGGCEFGIWGPDGNGDLEWAVLEGTFRLISASEGGGGHNTSDHLRRRTDSFASANDDASELISLEALIENVGDECGIWGAEGNGELEWTVLQEMIQLTEASDGGVGDGTNTPLLRPTETRSLLNDDASDIICMT